MSLRLRLSLIFSLVVALAVAAPSAVLYLTAQRSLRSEMDRRLLVRAREVQYALWPGSEHPSPADLQPQNIDLSSLAELDAPGMQIEVLDNSGRLLKASDSLQGRTFPLSPVQLQSSLKRKPAFEDAAVGERPVRVVTVPVMARDQVAAVLQVSQSRTVLQDTMVGLRRVLIVIGSIAVLLAGGIGWCVSYLGLRPLSAISSQAADIAARKDFRRRLALRRRDGEIGKLADTIDGLLAKVQDTFQAHRDFIADTSHELRNPLLAISTNAGLLNRLNDPHERVECVQEIQQQARRMSRLIADLLLLAQVERGLVLESRQVDLLDIVESTVREARLRAHGQVIRVQHQQALQLIGDPDRLRQILNNLLENAIRHTPANGMITVRTEPCGDGVEIQVEDTGDGISAEDLSHIFERGFQIDDSHVADRSRHGLGLAIVKYLTEAHGGQVAVRSQLHQGTCFTIWLPSAMDVHALRVTSRAGASPSHAATSPKLRRSRAGAKSPRETVETSV